MSDAQPRARGPSPAPVTFLSSLHNEMAEIRFRWRFVFGDSTRDTPYWIRNTLSPSCW